MKNFLIFVFALSFGSVHSQTTKLSLQGGVWTGYNISEKSLFLGLVGPKVSVCKSLPKATIEIGFTGVPGLFFGPKNRLGLVAGPTLTLFKKGKRGKLLISYMFYKSAKWHGVPGIGLIF
ncbi:MAG TPA: hypothetical protein VJB09_02795 [Candidatus Paceibacterota bacterium]